MRRAISRIMKMAWGRGRCRNRLMYCFKYRVNVQQHIVIPKTQYLIATRMKPSISKTICFTLLMLTAIHFNDQRPLYTDEIDNIGAYRFLPFELEAGTTMAAQVIPKLVFRIGHVAT